MIIYKDTWLNNLWLQNQANDAYREGCITENEVNVITEKYPVGFYKPGILIRIGLFLLTCIIMLFSMGLLTLMFSSSGIIDGFGWTLFLSCCSYIALEIMVKEKHHYQSGVDDALLYITFGLFLGSFIWMMNSLFSNFGHFNYLGINLFTCILCLYFTLRFGDQLMSFLLIASFLAVIYFAWKHLGSVGLATMPFIMMLVSALIYVLSDRMTAKRFVKWYYAGCLTIIKVVSLLTFYLAGNYYVVQTLSNQLNGNSVINAPIHFGLFFWSWTILIPFSYLFMGILKKDSILLRAGLLLVAAAIFTVRYYYAVLPTEWALTFGGIILLAVVYSIIKYLKKPKFGFTYAEKSNAGYMDHLKIESLIIAQSVGNNATTSSESATRFGGGTSGGGGATGSY